MLFKKVTFIICCMLATIALNSCGTGYSKSSYISSFEKFIQKVEKNHSTYDEDDWRQKDKKMAAFDKKYEKYADELSTSEKKKIVKLSWKYKYLRGKSKVTGIWGELQGIVGEGIEMYENAKTELENENAKTELENWSDFVEDLIE